ncbi:cell division protein FtsX [Photobacterium damselae subsp. piscicida]|uniref:Cell division protein FtsX n=1 Tax=Photobacterium damsela subsp. piscicida TaxID=38294 RepID=A0A1Q9H262_PHODP|nr:permease-like cell division protein FtsX [Photobacterium damselae]MBE8128041.1 cell division protein FtsX [Photobacterium damselae subsp. piscicida]MDP2516467.1 permease-like cell division protein FtsX [Photobacterium damselae subsp. piscicida]MDP2544024.1 permease-like cell division protein FtsX [Photobacterium damselae subsp. piscicida]MDP2568592.1 permease-like cell division protein FtsX [Photobacterium damselae subsp. piscicida]OLQ81879.1 cell division protein FtsX [Photobacterium damse
MAQNKQGFFAIHKQQGGGALKDMFRRPLGNILTLLVLAFALTLPATFYLLAKNVTIVAQSWQNPTQLTLYLQNSVPEAQAKTFADELKGWPEVETVEFISPQQGLEEFRQNAGFAKAIALLDSNPLPSVVIIKPKPQWQSNEQAQVLATKLRDQQQVSEVRLDSDWLQRLAAIKDLAVTLALVMSGLMLFAVFLIVGNTLRLQVLSHKDEIQVMKMVGATNSYILRPYLYVGVWYGLIASVIAIGLTFAITLLLDQAVATLANLYASHYRLISLGWDEMLILIMSAAFLGLLAARLSAGRHLREIEPV